MMGGKANVWKSGKGKPTGLQDDNGRVVPQQDLKFTEQ